MEAKSLGRAIRYWRDRIGWKQVQLAKAAGMHPSTLSALENRGQGLDTDLFIRLCKLMDANPVELADRAYVSFRDDLGREVDRMQIGQPQEAGAGRSVTPSLDEIMELYDEVAATHRSLLLGILRMIHRDVAESAYLKEQLKDVEREPGAPRTREKTRKPDRRARVPRRPVP